MYWLIGAGHKRAERFPLCKNNQLTDMRPIILKGNNDIDQEIKFDNGITTPAKCLHKNNLLLTVLITHYINKK